MISSGGLPLFVLPLKSAFPGCDTTELLFLFTGKNEKMPARRQHPDQDLTEEELARYVQELQKHQVGVRLGRSPLGGGVPSASGTCRLLVDRGGQQRDLCCLEGQIQALGCEM